jgi:hypothetical protein
MSGDDEGAAFTFDLDVPPGVEGEHKDAAIRWLRQLADQLAEQPEDDRTLTVRVTGSFDDEYPEGAGDSDSAPGGPASPCGSRKAVVNIMVCPGRRPYA